MIGVLIESYYPGWSAPADTGAEWERCLCPFHGESNPSAAISFEHNAFNCMGCDWRGDVYAIIQRKEGVGFGEAKRIAENLPKGSGDRVHRATTGKSSGGTSQGEGLATRRSVGSNRKVPARIRRRPLTGI